MRDAAALALRIQALAGLLALGCTRGDPQPNVQPDPATAKTNTTTTTTTTATSEPTTTDTTVATTDPTPTPSEPPPPKLPGFSCPTEDWCGTAAMVASLEDKAGGRKMDCPVSLDNPKFGTALPGVKNGWSWGNLDETATKEARSKAKAKAVACCYTLGHPCGGGRPLMDDGAAIVATSRPRADWLQADVTPAILDALDGDTRRALGEAWLEDAAVEHASIASFSRVSMELMAIGAPAELVEASHRAALDEARHARICFALARAYLRRDVGPGPLPLPSPRASSLADVAADAFLEGCVGESVSALVASRAAEACVDAEVKRHLASMARDEETHAALAFRVVAWCVAMGGDSVARRLEALLAAAPAVSFGAGKIGVSALGRLDEGALAGAAGEAWSAVVVPTMRALLRG